MHAPFNHAFRVEWRTLPALAALADQWRMLAERAIEPNVFYEPAFALNAAPVFGANAGALLVWTKMGRLVGLFPVRRERWRGGPGAASVGWAHPYAPLGTPLVDREEADAVIEAWLDHLAADPAAPGLLLLPLVPEHGPFATALNAVLARGHRRSAAFSCHQRALLAPGVDRAGYLERAVPTRKRKELRRQRRRLEEIAALRFTTATSPADIGSALQDFLVLEASGWKGIAGTAAVNDTETRHFIETTVTALAAEGKARIDRMALNGRAIAAAITLTSGGTAWCWKIAYSEAFSRSSPGVQLALELTDSLLGRPEIARADSCATANHPMIDHIWRERLPLCDRLIALKSWAWTFALACQFEGLRRALIATAKRLRDRLPLH
jgi:CelD/BcsL family acetyltransferase involved in cellulose biosynthesis